MDRIGIIIFSFYVAFLCYGLMVDLVGNARNKAKAKRNERLALVQLLERSKKVILHRINADLDNCEVKIQFLRKSIDEHMPIDYKIVFPDFQKISEHKYQLNDM